MARPLVTSLVTLTNHPGGALLSSGRTTGSAQAGVGGRGQPVWRHRARDEHDEGRRGRRGSKPRRCRHRTVPMRQVLQEVGRGRYRAGRRVLTNPLCRLVESFVDRFRRGSSRRQKKKESMAPWSISTRSLPAQISWCAVSANQANLDELVATVACERDAPFTRVKVGSSLLS